MSSIKRLEEKLLNGSFDKAFTLLYRDIPDAQKRYSQALLAFTDRFGQDREPFFFSAPGRTELGGNHTDHNRGRVLAASIDLDVIAVAAKRTDGHIRVISEGYPAEDIHLADLTPHFSEKNSSAALIRGIAARMVECGYKIGGFDAYTSSRVLKGSGLSSSAAFEVLLCTILSEFYNDGSIPFVERAKISQYAENVYFGKPCGLMDQIACAAGGTLSIDFMVPEEPVIDRMDTDFQAAGYTLCVVDTGGNHANLTPEYAAIPHEMKQVAEFLGVSRLRETNVEQLMREITPLRKQLGDRAVLRALHFFEESDRVVAQTQALRQKDFSRYLDLVLDSGRSSFEYLQNAYAISNIKSQGIPLALCLAQRLLAGRGAWRVHGGGFAGTTQNYVPHELVPAFSGAMEAAFGPGCCHQLRIRPVGGICLDALQKDSESGRS